MEIILERDLTRDLEQLQRDLERLHVEQDQEPIQVITGLIIDRLLEVEVQGTFQDPHLLEAVDEAVLPEEDTINTTLKKI